jgi:large subunit ribosomal protein L5
VAEKNQVAKEAATDEAKNKAAKAGLKKAEKEAVKTEVSSEKKTVKAEAAASEKSKKSEVKADAGVKKAVIVPRLKTYYETTVVPYLMKQFKYSNVNQVPKLSKIVLNMGLGDIKDNSKSVQIAVEELKAIAGQKPVLTAAKKSVANFKVRKGMSVGAKVTLRRERMYEFLDKLLSIALPRVRDFRGLSPDSFDGRGNYALGIKEQLIFPEINFDQIEKIRGLDVCIVTTAKTDEEGRELLKALGLPFKAN